MSRLFTAGVSTAFVASSLQVVQRGSGANMSVDVSVGDAHVLLPSGAKSYWCWQDAVTNVTVTAANATNPRIDTVVAWLDQTVTTTGSNNSPGSFKFRIFDGTPAGTPAAVSDATIQSTLGASIGWVKLATLNVAANASTITNAVITDARVTVSAITTAKINPDSITPDKMLGIDLFGRTNAGITTGTVPSAGTGQFYIQTGTSLASTNAGGGGSVGFQNTFPNGVLSVLVTNGESGSYRNGMNIIANQVSTSGFGFQLNTDTSATVRVNWIAIGW